MLIDGLLSLYDKKTGIDWKWQWMDGVITKAPLGVICTRYGKDILTKEIQFW